MRIVFHIGMHQTDGDRLVRSLLKNRAMLATRGVTVPGPGRYRTVLRDAVNKLRGEEASAETQKVLLEAISDIERPERVILSNESFICLPDRVLDDGRLYGRAFKTVWLRNLFPDAAPVFAMGLRDPATFLPALFEVRRNRELAFDEYLLGVDPEALRWSDMVATILELNPSAEVVAWCNEDTPLVWPSVLASLAGVGGNEPLAGVFDVIAQIVDADGRSELDALWPDGRAADSADLRARMADIAERRLDAASVEEVIDLPGWSAATMAALSAAYDSDVARIQAMERVRFLSP